MSPNGALTYAAGTVVTSDYLPWARVLSDSFAEHNPQARFVVAFSATDDMTVVIRAGGRDPQRLECDLKSLLGTLGLDDPDSPDMLGLVDPVAPGALAPLADVVLTRRAADPALAHLPHANGVSALRAIFDASHSPELEPSRT